MANIIKYKSAISSGERATWTKTRSDVAGTKRVKRELRRKLRRELKKSDDDTGSSVVISGIYWS